METGYCEGGIMPEYDHLQALRELTPLLSMRPLYTPHTVEHHYELGTSILRGIMWKPECSVQDVFISNGTRTTPESSPSHLSYVVYSGEAVFSFEGEERNVVAGSTLSLSPNVAYIINAVTDLWMIRLSIPASEEYRGATEHR